MVGVLLLAVLSVGPTMNLEVFILKFVVDVDNMMSLLSILPMKRTVLFWSISIFETFIGVVACETMG